jgi:hypothetical protein
MKSGIEHPGLHVCEYCLWSGAFGGWKGRCIPLTSGERMRVVGGYLYHNQNHDCHHHHQYQHSLHITVYICMPTARVCVYNGHKCMHCGENVTCN